MDLRFGHLSDYASVGASGKLIIVGIFDQVIHTPNGEPVRLPLCYLVFRLQCSIAEGTEHQIQVRAKDEDERTLLDDEGKPLDMDLGIQRFTPSGPGRPLMHQAMLTISGLVVPGVGDYAFEVRIGGTPIGEIPFYVVEPAITRP